MSLKAQIEAIIYVAEEPVTLAQLTVALSVPPETSSVTAPSVAPAAVAPAELAPESVALESPVPEAVAPESAPPENASAPDNPADSAAAPAPEPELAVEPAAAPAAETNATVEPAMDPEAQIAELLTEAPVPDLVLTSPPAPLTQEDIRVAVEELIADYRADARGLEIKEVAGGYKMATKPEHHEVVRRFVKSLKPPMKLSLAALETLAVVAYRQPVTVPEIGEVRGVNTGGVIKTLLDKRLITTAGRKNVIGRPILYRTTKEFLLQFGLKDVSELPSLKEFEELARSLAPE
jgi:segregation and condensation protein B